MNIVIPMAGLGSRLHPLTKSITKNMISINNKSFLYYQYSNFKNYVNNIHCILGNKKNTFKKFIKKENFIRKKIIFYNNQIFKKTQCAFSISKVIPCISGPVIFINCDLLIKKKYFKFLYKSKSSIVLIRKKSKDKLFKRKTNVYLNSDRVLKFSFQSNSKYEAVGPVLLNKNDLEILKQEIKNVSSSQLKKLGCYHLFNKILSKITLKYKFISDNDWIEINSFDELNYLKTNYRKLIK